MIDPVFLNTPQFVSDQLSRIAGCRVVVKVTRVNLHKNARGGAVLQPVEPIGLHPAEWTMAEMLKERGYATAMLGKWLLGDQPPFLPTRQGFDRYVGVPYRDDMTERPGQIWPPLPMMRNKEVIDAPVDRNTLAVRETEEALRFIAQPHDRLFFLYIAHAMPGSTPAPFSSPAFRGKSRNGPWGDSVGELDWSLGQVYVRAAAAGAGLRDARYLDIRHSHRSAGFLARA